MSYLICRQLYSVAHPADYTLSLFHACSQETVSPAQLAFIVLFQRSIRGYLRERVRETHAHKLKNFVRRVGKKFSALIACLERAQVGGVVVTPQSVGDLAAAVLSALMATTPDLTKYQADQMAMAMIHVVPNCRLLRSFSYVRAPDWPFLREDVHTDGIVVLCSGETVSPMRIRPPSTLGAYSEYETMAGGARVAGEGWPHREFGEHKFDDSLLPRLGLFASLRDRGCFIKRRGTATRHLRQDGATVRAVTPTWNNPHEQLWLFHPASTLLLARVLCILRNGPAGRGASGVPYIFQRHLLRCAVATRLQAAWRGHVTRWNLMAPLTSCIVVARAALCLQRWWRSLTGITARLRLCRRLWALASAVRSSTMYMELDVFFTLTRGWRGASANSSVEFAFQSGGEVVHVLETRESDGNPCVLAALGPGGQDIDVRHEQSGSIVSVGALTIPLRPARATVLPFWASGSIVPTALRSELQHTPISHQVGALLTESVQAKRVVWPLTIAATTEAFVPATEADDDDKVAGYALPEAGSGVVKSSESFSTEIWASSGTTSEGHSDAPEPYPSALDNSASVSSGLPVDLRESHDGIEMVELTFASAREARARALLVAVATEDSGVAANRPVAQLMTLEMLYKAAAGKAGLAVPKLEKPATGFKRGDDVEMFMLRFSEGVGGGWHPGVIDRDNGDGRFKVRGAFVVKNPHGWADMR